MWKKILLASNGVEQDRLAMEEAVALAKRFAISLEIHGVVDVNEEFETTAPGLTDKLRGKLKSTVDGLVQRALQEGVEAGGSVSVGDASSCFEERAKGVGADLVIMGTRTRTGISRFLMGSMASSAIGYIKRPVMVVKGEPKRGQYKSILVPTDGSETSSKAIKAGCVLAKETGGKVTVLNVIPVYGDQVDLATKTGLSEVFAGESKAIMAKAEEVAKEYNVNVNFLVVDEGYPADEIVRVANEEKADLIVIGSHGSTGVTHIVMGSTAEQVLHQSSCPVLVIKQ